MPIFQKMVPVDPADTSGTNLYAVIAQGVDGGKWQAWWQKQKEDPIEAETERLAVDNDTDSTTFDTPEECYVYATTKVEAYDDQLQALPAKGTTDDTKAQAKKEDVLSHEPGKSSSGWSGQKAK